ncbi:MAG: glycosyltransferase [Erysipelotrichaceae bacterium]|jgi:glycosyltransferase involved in cell wall biosynthesis|nr:glycosyltransferase [Erysipelotrichaceae bacterium]
MEQQLVLVVYSLRGGGAERQVAATANLLVRQGIRVSVLVMFRDEKEYPLDSSIAIYSIFKNREVYLKTGKIKKFFLMRKLVRSIKIKTLWSYDENISFFIKAFIKRRIKLVNFVLNARSFQTNRFRADYVIKHSFKNVLQNEEQKKYYDQNTLEKSVVIPNPMDFDSIVPKLEYREKITRIYMVGRMVPVKNYPLAIKAFKLVHDKYPEVRLDIYGTYFASADNEAMMKFIQEAKLNDVVTFHGFSVQVREEAKNYDLFLMTSITEGLPNALIEAMATGVPAVVTNFETGSCDLLGNNNERGIITLQTPEAVAEGIIKMINDPTLATSYAMKAKTYVNTFLSEKVIIGKLLELARENNE